ncbi:hypothetical protein GOP47_0029697 [Adiantum capillus-veneris]|nr:hypothetical protein GOP47_0029697 [Adiantum capillus-veneris]
MLPSLFLLAPPPLLLLLPPALFFTPAPLLFLLRPSPPLFIFTSFLLLFALLFAYAFVSPIAPATPSTSFGGGEEDLLIPAKFSELLFIHIEGGSGDLLGDTTID